MKTSLVRGTIISVALFALTATSAYAQYGAYGQYGGPSSTTAILMDKMVGKVTSSKGGVAIEYVDNIASSDPRFKPSDEVSFRLRVKNTSGVTLTGVTITDTLPAYMVRVDSDGSYNDSNRTITINAGDLTGGQEKSFTVRAKIVSQNDLPADRSIVCIVNKAVAVSGSIADDDSAQFCVEKTVGTASQVPSAGPEAGIGLMGLYSVALASGLYLRKRAK